MSEQYGSGRFGFGMREYFFARDQSSFWLPDQPNPQPVNETDMRVLAAAVRVATQVYAARSREEWLSKIPQAGVRRRAELL